MEVDFYAFWEGQRDRSGLILYRYAIPNGELRYQGKRVFG